MTWSEKLRGALGAVKDTGASAAIHRWLQREMTDYGEVLDFKFCSGARSAELHVLLKGETLPLTVHVNDYTVVERDGGDYIVVTSAQASREWVNAVLRKFVINKPQRIPPQYSSLAKIVLQR